MKTILLLLSLFVTSLTLQAQNVDSLINILNTQKLTPAEQMKLCDEICDGCIDFDTQTALIYTEKGLKIAEKEKDKLNAALFNEYLGIAYKFDGKKDTALIFFEKALKLAEEAADKKMHVSVLGNIGNLYGGLEKDDIALEYYMKALAICEEMGDRRQYANVLARIGGTYRMMRNTDRAIHYLEQAKDIHEEMGNLRGQLHTYYDLGSCYRFKWEYDKAGEYSLKALALAREQKNMQYEIMILQLLSKNELEGYENFDKALEYANQSLVLAEKYGDQSLIIGALSDIAYTYRFQGRYKECDAISRRLWAMDSTSLMAINNVAADLIIANIHLGNKTDALNFYYKQTAYLRQYINQSYQEQLMNLEVKYETEKKETRIATLEKEKKLYIWLGVAIVAALLFSFSLLFVRHKLNVQKRRMAEQQVKQLEQEKQLIATQAVLDGETAERSRLARDLHDGLGGMLSVVKLNLKDMKNYSIIDGPDVNRFNKALQMLDESIGELRRVAHHMMPESLMRYGLKVSLEDFCKAIPGAHFQYLGEDPRLDSRLEVLIYRCAYELINNAVKHAKATNINVQLMIDNGVVSLTVYDDGIGFDPDKVTLGAGLENIRTRVAAYNGKMNIYSAPGKGTEISIEIESL